MPLVPRRLDHAAEVKALIEQLCGLSLSALIGFLLANQNLDLLGQQTTDRRAPTGGQDFRLPKRLARQANGKILLGHVSRPHVLYVYHVFYVQSRKGAVTACAEARQQP